MSFEQFKSDMTKAIEAHRAAGIQLIHSQNFVFPTGSNVPCGMCALHMLYAFRNKGAAEPASVFYSIDTLYGPGISSKFIAGFDDGGDLSPNQVIDFGREIRKQAEDGFAFDTHINYQFQVWAGEYHFEGFVSDKKEDAENYVKSLKEIGGKAYAVRVLKGKLPTREQTRAARLVAFPAETTK